MAWHRKTVLKYVSLAVGCLCTVAGGSIAAINAYSSDLRDTFNLTQSQGAQPRSRATGHVQQAD